jgi:phosphatidylglycerophosphatase A
VERLRALPRPKGAADRAAFALALWFGCGRAPYAPGTAGSLGALPVYFAVTYGAGVEGRPLALLLVGAAITAAGTWASERVARAAGITDPQQVCVDEVAGVLLTWAAAPFTWPGVLAGFVLFRLFDIVKPWPARALERLPGGLGIMFDDVAAAGWAALVLSLLRAVRWM